MHYIDIEPFLFGLFLGLYELCKIIFIRVKCEKTIGIIVENHSGGNTGTVGFRGPFYKGFISSDCVLYKYYYRGDYYTAYGDTVFFLPRKGKDCRIWVYRKEPEKIFSNYEYALSLVGGCFCLWLIVAVLYV